MCLPSVTCSSVALATPYANSKKMQSAFLMISLRLQFSADTVEMFSGVEIRLLLGVKGTELTEVFCLVVCCFFDLKILHKFIFKYYALHFVKVNTMRQTTENKRKAGFNTLILKISLIIIHTVCQLDQPFIP